MSEMPNLLNQELRQESFAMEAPVNPEIFESPTQMEQGETMMEPKKKLQFLPKTWQKVLFALLLLLVLLGVIAGVMVVYTLSVVQELKTEQVDLMVTAHGAYDQFKGQNLPGVQDGVKTMGEKIKVMRQTYSKLAFLNVLPIAHSYYQDGIHGFNAADAGISAGTKTLDAVAPHADVLGFKGQGTFAGGTFEDRLKTILQTLQEVTPALDSVEVDLNTMKTELGQIDPNRYPENFQGKPVRSYVTQAQDVSNGAVTALTQFRPVIEQLPSLAGADGKRKKYFILFENDNELRPTGGFMTAYALVYVENGKVTLDKSDDIYQLDKKSKDKLPIPEVMGRFLTTEKYFNIRDMNINPDFKLSMEQFLQRYLKLPDEPRDIDGLIAVDTQVLTDIMRVLGPLDVPGFGTFTTNNSPKCDCPEIIYTLSEITDRPTPFVRQDRKGILGPMMRALLTKAYTAPKTLWPQLFATAWKDIQARHAQAYFFDAKAQNAAELINAAGRMQLDPKAPDFLAVIDANLGGAKSNLFITTDMKQEVSAPANGMIDKKITLTYKNSRHGDNCNLEAGLLCLNATLRDWNRLYIPHGSKLVNSQGYTSGSVKQYDEGDFTVIEGTFLLEPQSQSKLQIEYTVPYADTTNYKVKLWKQAGTKDMDVLFDVAGGEEKVTLDKDILFQTKF
jgi:hypothetical protein